MATVENIDKVLTVTHVKKIFNLSDAKAAEWHPVIKGACDERGITKLLRLAAFLANIFVESGALTRFSENLNYSETRLLEVFPKYFDAASAKEYARKPEKIASRVYGNRMGNGAESSGEGYTYAGKGAIQLTGKDNYKRCHAAGIPCLGDQASNLLTPSGAMRSAAWFWSSKNLNEYADRNDFNTVCTRINGGSNARAERVSNYQRAIVILSDGADNTTPAEAAAIVIQPSNTSDPSEPVIPSSKIKSITEPIVSGNAQYPWNKVFESRSGHLIEIDDTPSAERLHWYHRTGTYAEMQPNGDYVTKAKHDRYELVDGDLKESVGGDSSSAVSGTLYQKVGGDATFNVGGAFSISSGGVVNVDAPSMKVREEIIVPYIECQMLTMKPGSKYSSSVADIKVRDSEHAGFADVAGALGQNGNPGASIQGGWVSRISSQPAQVGSLLRYEPSLFHSSGVLIDDNSDVIINSVDSCFEEALRDKEVSVGGDFLEHNQGIREIVSGESLLIASDTVVQLESKKLVVVDDGKVLLEYDREVGVIVAPYIAMKKLRNLKDLPEANKANEGLILMCFYQGKQRCYESVNGEWDEVL